MSGPGGWSLQRRLVVVVTAVVAAGLLIASAASYLLLRTYLIDRLDAQLVRATGGDGRPEARDSGGVPRPRPDGRRDDDGPPSEFVIAQVSAAGQVLGVDSGALARGSAPDLTGFDAARVAALAGAPTTVGQVGGGAGYRVVARTQSDGTSLVLAAPLQPVQETASRYLLLVGLVDLVVLVALVGLAWWAVRLGLRPLEEVEATADRIAAGDLSQRAPESAPGTEVGRLSRAFNAMLDQITAAFAARDAGEERLRRFIADASHELRTPLTSIRGYAELQRRGALTDPQEVASAVGRIESEAERMGRLVDDMLLLARLDQQRPLERADVDLAALVSDAVDAARARSADHTWTLSVPPAPVLLVGDPDRLRQVVDNLLTNAAQHTGAGTTVSAEVVVDPTVGAALLTIADDGPGMAPDVVPLVFERFYRADPSRARAAGGSGLGLSIAQAVVEAHGGTIACTSQEGVGTAFRLSLPLASTR